MPASLGTVAGPLSTTVHHLLLQNSPGCLRPRISAGLSGNGGVNAQQSLCASRAPHSSKGELPGTTACPVEHQVLPAPDVRLCILECHLLALSPILVYIYTCTPPPSPVRRVMRRHHNSTAFKKVQVQERASGQKPPAVTLPQRRVATHPWFPPRDGEHWPKALVWDGLFLRSCLLPYRRDQEETGATAVSVDSLKREHCSL